jgi:hypothetical protein
VGSFRQETSCLNTKIDNAQTQLLEKHDRFDRSSTSGDSAGLPPPSLVHKL